MVQGLEFRRLRLEGFEFVGFRVSGSAAGKTASSPENIPSSHMESIIDKTSHLRCLIKYPPREQPTCPMGVVYLICSYL